MLERLFPVHEVYVEPFFGGGAVFFGKSPSNKEVVNDLDSQLVQDYQRVVDAPTSASAYPTPTTLAAQRRFLSGHQSTVGAKVVESILRRCNGFAGTYVEDASALAKNSNPAPKIKNIAAYKERLGSATLLNQDYRKVIRKYDSAKTFFFLDPPYEKSDGLGYAAGSESFDFDEMAKVLKGIKGDFLITINDSPRIRDAFAGFQLYPYGVKGHHSKTSHIGQKDRKELLITNYTLPQNWRRGGTHREHVVKELGLEADGHSLDELAKASGVSKDVLQQVYNRGIGAYKTNPTSVRMKGTYEKGVEAPYSQKLSKEQWAMARVYSFLDGNPKHDQDLRGEGNPFFKNYLRAVKVRAELNGYDPDAVRMADDGIHKVEYKTPTGQTVRFGRVGYGDFILWTHLEREGKVPKGYALRKRAVFHKSHEAIKGDWKTNPYSPNNLALALLW